MKPNNYLSLIKQEGWEVKKGEDGSGKVIVYGREFPVTHPCLIHLKLYRSELNPEIKYTHMKAAHDYLWPMDVPTWHYWTEDRFRTHCAGYNYISWAGGSSTTKSYDSAKNGLLFWWANPKKRGVIIASTTLASLESRVWGYMLSLINRRAVKLPMQYFSGNSPKVLYPIDKSKGELKDAIHGIFAVAAKEGSDESAINTWIGRHPEDALMLILDECTDLNTAVSKAFINLDSSEKPFQCLGIGNSNSWFDLHGMLSYPKDGIESVNPDIDTRWPTTQKNGICLYFDCYNSPAIHETDPKKKKLLSRFLITQEQVNDKEKHYGKDSDAFYRFVRGFWRAASSDNVVASSPFLDAHKVANAAEWLGVEPLKMVAGLDPAFSSGGDRCLLRLGVLGQTVDGNIILDFRDDKLMFNIAINAKVRKAVEIQIAEQVIAILNQYGIPLSTLCIDANGQGRALGGTIQLQANALIGPTKIYSVRSGDTNVRSFDVKIIESYELWNDLRKFIESDQIKGLDKASMMQLTNRLFISHDSDGKPCKPRLENKLQFKRRMGAIMPSLAHSPDEADSAVLCLQSAIIHCGFHVGQKKEITTVSDFAHEKLVRYKQQQIQMRTETQDVHKSGLKPGFRNGVTDFHGIKFRS